MTATYPTNPSQEERNTMPVKIKVAGKSTEKPAAKPARSTGRKATTRKGTTSARASAKRTERAKPAAAKSSDGPVRRASKNVDPRTEARLLKAVAKAGERRAKAEMEHKESINALHDAAREAIAGGVSMAKVADESGISRQWLYKMGDFAEREGVTAGNGNGKTAAAKPAATRRAPAKSTTAKPAATRRAPARARTAAKPAGKTRTRIRSRA
jgi:hypothetical protein